MSTMTGLTRRRFAVAAPVCAAASQGALPRRGRNTHYSTREPLQAPPFLPLPLGAVRPRTFLLEQLRLLGEGLTGRLDEHYPDILGPRNAWLGGDGDCGEKAPYWLDGLLPLAHLLRDARLIAKSARWVDAILASQRPDGSFGPQEQAGRPQPEGTWPENLQKTGQADWWSRMPVLKALQAHYEATGDARILPFLNRYFRYQLATLPSQPLDRYSRWGRDRSGENLASIFWLFNRTGEPFLIELARLVFAQSTDWTGYFLSGALCEPTRETLSRKSSTDRGLPALSPRHLLAGVPPARRYTGLTHGVNVAMALKQPAVFHSLSGDARHLNAVRKVLADLTLYHGLANGMYSADEWLHGSNPTQGIELCAVVEMMFSLETLLAATGWMECADRLERIAYNALPAQWAADLATRQYYQQANQIRCTAHPHNFQTDGQRTDDLRFGLHTGYICCSVNGGQGWSKFVEHLWYASADNGLAALIYGPCDVTARVADGASVTITETTNYPFDESVEFTLAVAQPVAFPLYLRIPGWCEGASYTVNAGAETSAAPGTLARIEREWKHGDRVRLQLPAKVRLSRWHDASLAVERGPLLFALRIDERWQSVAEQHGVPVWDVNPASAWNYGLVANEADPETNFRLTRRDVPPQPWTVAGAPISLEASARRIPFWQEYSAMAGPLPGSSRPVHTNEPEERVTLIPYGCTRLRISQFPQVPPAGRHGGQEEIA